MITEPQFYLKRLQTFEEKKKGLPGSRCIECLRAPNGVDVRVSDNSREGVVSDGLRELHAKEWADFQAKLLAIGDKAYEECRASGAWYPTVDARDAQVVEQELKVKHAEVLALEKELQASAEVEPEAVVEVSEEKPKAKKAKAKKQD